MRLLIIIKVSHDIRRQLICLLARILCKRKERILFLATPIILTHFESVVQILVQVALVLRIFVHRYVLEVSLVSRCFWSMKLWRLVFHLQARNLLLYPVTCSCQDSRYFRLVFKHQVVHI